MKNKTIKTICAYCEEAKQCVKWDKTDEMVCYDCRLRFLDEEFEEPKEYKSDLFPDFLKDFPSIRK
jgi:hypothetical protein